MAGFSNITELINLMDLTKPLIDEMFRKRRSFQYKYEQAVEIIDEDRVNRLINVGVIRQNGVYLELDELFQDFFEQVLEVNEDINTSYIHENIQQVKQNINFYLQETNANGQYRYLKQIKSMLRKSGRITLRNIIDLNRNIENTFKTEPNYRIKIAKLEALDDKRRLIYALVEQIERLISDDEKTFFVTATDDELRHILHHLKQQLTEARHNLIETQKQIIHYLNQVKYHSGLFIKIRQLKYLKDQFEIRSKTNLNSLAAETQDLIFDSKPSYSIKLSLDFLQTDEAYQSIKKVVGNGRKLKANQLSAADSISTDYLHTTTEEEIYINLYEIKNSFLSSGNHLFQFLDTYKFPRPVDYAEKVTVFCQLIGMFENEFDIKEEYQSDDQVEYAIVLPGGKGSEKNN